MKTAKLASALLIVVMLSACGAGANTAPTPTAVDVGAVQTAVVQTVVANLTLSAPSETPAPSLTPAPDLPSATPTVTATATQARCDDSIFVSDVSVPDGTQMTAGQAFVKTWKVRNTGTCAWKTNYQLIFAYGIAMGGLPTMLPSEVAPGTEVEISINLKAPLKSGNAGGYWRLANNNGVPFGQIFTVLISVP